MSKKDKSPVAVQSNSLISARYRLSLGEQRMVLMMISKIDYEDSAFQGYEISIKELASTLQINEDCAYREAQSVTDKLLKRLLRIQRADGSLLKCAWIAEAIHKPGSVTLTPAPSLRPYLLELRERFTIVPLAQIKGLRSQYSVRIYMLLRQHISLGKFDLAVDDFREMLTLENKYKRFNELRRWVLDAAKKELDGKADISFSLETIRTGKTITSLSFTVVKNKIELKKKYISKNKHVSTKQSCFPEYWDEFLGYVQKHDPGLLPIIEKDGPQCGIVMHPYIQWLEKFKK